MAKVAYCFIIASSVIVLIAYPLEENGHFIASSTEGAADFHSSANEDVKSVPLLDAEKISGENDSVKTLVTVKNDSSNHNVSPPEEERYVEESYIQVLLPGTPQLNASAIQSLLDSTLNSTDTGRSKRNSIHRKTSSSTESNINRGSSSRSSSLSNSDEGTYSTNTRLKRHDVDDSFSHEKSSEETSKTFKATISTTPLYSAQNFYSRAGRDVSKKERSYLGSSTPGLSEPTRSSSSTKPPLSEQTKFRPIRETPEKDGSQNSRTQNKGQETTNYSIKKEIPTVQAQLPAIRKTRKSDSPEIVLNKKNIDSTTSLDVPNITTEKTVYITPQSRI